MHHQAQQSHAVMQNKSLIYGDPCESGYSTTASSEEGTLQRGFTKKQNGGFESESFLNNPKFLEMVSRSKGCDYSYSPASSHGSADSPLAFGIPDHIPATIDAFRHVDDVTSVDEINVAALQKFKDNLENIRTYQTAKPQKPAFSYYDPLHIADVPQGKTTKSTSPSSKCGSPQKPIPMRRSQNKHRGPINFSSEAPKTVETSIKSISPTADHKSAFVVVKPRVIHRPSPTESKPLAYQHTCSHDTCEKSNPLPAVRPRKTTERIPTLSPIDNSIVYIPAQIDENGIARPVESRSSKRMCARNKKNSNRNEVAGDEAARLREYLEKAEAKDLKYALEKLLKSKDPNSIEAMTKLFPTNKKPEASHCLRCHKVATFIDYDLSGYRFSITILIISL